MPARAPAAAMACGRCRAAGASGDGHRHGLPAMRSCSQRSRKLTKASAGARLHGAAGFEITGPGIRSSVFAGAVGAPRRRRRRRRHGFRSTPLKRVRWANPARFFRVTSVAVTAFVNRGPCAQASQLVGAAVGQHLTHERVRPPNRSPACTMFSAALLWIVGPRPARAVPPHTRHVVDEHRHHPVQMRLGEVGEVTDRAGRVRPWIEGQQCRGPRMSWA